MRIETQLSHANREVVRPGWGGLGLLMVMVGVLTLVAPWGRSATAQEIELPEAFAKTPPSEPAEKPGSRGVDWKVVLASEPATLYTDPTGQNRVRVDRWPAERRPKYGDVVNVMYETKTAGRRLLLLAKFGADRKFRYWIGWTSPELVLEDDVPLKVSAARAYLTKVIPEDDKRYTRIQNEMPDASRPEFANTTLKAVTQPSKGKYCFLRPTLPTKEAEDKAIAEKLGTPLQPFSFFYIYKLLVQQEYIYCLVAAKPQLEFVDAGVNDPNFRGDLIGWIEMGSLTLWTTREAFEYNLTEEALSARKKSSTPIELFKTQKDLTDYYKLREAGDRKSTEKFLFREDFTADYMLAPWKPHMMRYPILDRYSLPGKALANGEKPTAFQICVLGSGDDNKDLKIDQTEFNKAKAKVNDAIRNLRVFEIVLVLDRTANMSPLFGVLVESIDKLVAELKSKETAAKIPEQERVVLRIAVVGFWDHAANDPLGTTPKLTETSERFFDLSSEDGRGQLYAHLRSLSTRGGGDLLNEPLEGVRTAVETFLSDRAGSKHTPGAARMLALFSGHGNHDASSGGITKIDLPTVTKLLQNPDTRNSDTSKTNKPGLITFVAIRTPVTDKPCEAWDRQMPELARLTKGFTAEVSLQGVKTADAKKELSKKLTEQMAKAIEERRKVLREEIRAVQMEFARGGDQDLINTPVTPLMRSRIAESLGTTEDLEKLKSQLSGFFFTNLRAVERLPQDPAEQPRMLLNVLLTFQELVQIQDACGNLARELDRELSKVNPNAELTQTVFKDLVIRTMITVMGSQAEVSESELRKLRSLPLEKIQAQVNRLPIVFGCLKGEGPKNAKEVRGLAKTLARAAGDLRNVIIANKERFFDPGVGAGELHIWLKPVELP